MRTSLLVVCLLVTSLLAAAPAAAQNIHNASVTTADGSAGIAAAIAAGRANRPSWYAWTVPSSGGSVCCWSGNGNRRASGCCGRCMLDGNGSISINTTDDRDEPRVASDLMMLVRVDNGSIRRIRYFSTTCEIDGQGQRITVLNNVSPEASITWLASQVRDAGDPGDVVAAVSMHDHPRAVNELIALARNHSSQKVRRGAIFWLGQKAGDKAAGELRRAVDEDPDADVRQHAVFAISQLPRDRAVPMLIELVKTHKSRSVREKAMFWLAQTGDPRAIDVMAGILGEE